MVNCKIAQCNLIRCRHIFPHPDWSKAFTSARYMQRTHGPDEEVDLKLAMDLT